MFRSAVVRSSVIASAARFSGPALRAGFSSAPRLLAAQAFKFPAMSPTMKVGGIVEWAVKEGDEFSSGDVLLDVETDKAQIAVEAADDGVMVKIFNNDGDKDIPVGQCIAVIADQGDDISAIDIEAFRANAAAPPPPNKKGDAAPAAPLAPVVAKPVDTQPRSVTAEPSAVNPPAPAPGTAANAQEFAEKARNQVAPAARRVLKQNGLHDDHIHSIEGTGPKGRVLKGDALAYVGAIPQDAPHKLRDTLESRRTSHLSNIEKAPSSYGSSPANAAKPAPKPIVKETFEVSIQDALGEFPKMVGPAVAKAHRLAIRDMLWAQRPKASILRDSVLDLVASPKSKTLFEAKLSHPIRRARVPKVIVDINYGTAEPTQAARDQVAEYKDLLKSYLTLVDEDLE